MNQIENNKTIVNKKLSNQVLNDTLPTLSSTITKAQVQPANPLLALKFTTASDYATSDQQTTTVNFNIAVDSNTTPNSNFIAIAGPSGNPAGTFTLQIPSPQTNNTIYYNVITVLNTSYNSGTIFDCAYVSPPKVVNPRTIRGTITVIGLP